MAYFDKTVDIVLKAYSRVEHTNQVKYGLTQRHCTAFGVDFDTLNTDVAKAVYYAQYWELSHGMLLPNDVAYSILMTAPVLQLDNTVRLIQQYLNLEATGVSDNLFVTTVGSKLDNMCMYMLSDYLQYMFSRAVVIASSLFNDPVKFHYTSVFMGQLVTRSIQRLMTDSQ